MKKWTYVLAITLLMTIPAWAMQEFTEDPSQTNVISIVCSRLTLEEHQKLATESEVKLWKKNLSDGDLKSLQPLMLNNPSLTKLDLFRNNIGANGAKILTSLPNLKILILEENNVGDEGAAAFESNTSLQTLNLFKNGITDLGVIPLTRNTTIKELGLYSNLITNCGAFAFPVNTTLRKLDVRRNQITNKGAEAIASSNTLQIVFLGRNVITDDGAKPFLNKDNFVHMDLKDTQVSNEVVQLFERAFPHNGFLIRFRHLIHPRLLPGVSHSSAYPPLPLASETVCLLSIDGGGIRGLIPALILQHLEEKLERKLGKSVALTQGFEWMAGTSTGGLIALGLNIPSETDPTQPKYPASQLVKLYQDYGKDIFPKPWCVGLLRATYDPKPLENLLSQYFGEVYLSQTLGHVLITAFNMGENAPYLFNSLKARRNPQKDFSVGSTARSTAAAPSYFPAAQVTNRPGKSYTFIDGGVYANNPAVIGIQQVQKRYPHAKKIVVLSLGTGEGLPDRTINRLENAGVLKWATEIGSHLMRNAAIVTEDTLQAQIRQDSRLRYFRIQASLANSETSMDNASAQNIQVLVNAAETTIRNHKTEIKEITKILMKKLSAASLSSDNP